MSSTHIVARRLGLRQADPDGAEAIESLKLSHARHVEEDRFAAFAESWDAACADIRRLASSLIGTLVGSDAVLRDAEMPYLTVGIGSDGGLRVRRCCRDCGVTWWARSVEQHLCEVAPW